MISTIRRKLVGTKFYKVIFWLVIISMLGLWTLPNLFNKRSGGRDTLWGTVNGRDIFFNDFERKVVDFEERLQMMRAEYGPYADQFMAAMGINTNPKVLASQGLMREVLLDNTADQLDIQVHPEYVQQAIDNISSSYHELSDLIPARAIDMRNGSIQTEPLRRHLYQYGLTMADFDAKLEQGLKRKLTGNLIANAAYVPKFELENEYSMQHVPKTFSVMTIPKSEILAEIKKDVISDNDIQTFFDRKNKANQAYWVPEKRTVTVWKITPQSYGITVSDEEISRYYEENKEKSFVTEMPKVQARMLLLQAATPADLEKAREQALKIREHLVANPGDFAAKAKDLSADTETASNGGLMKPFAKGDAKIEKNFERAAFLLKNKNDISEPIQVKDGIVLLQLVEKKPKLFKPLAEARKDISDVLITQKFSKRFVQDMKEIYKDKNEAKLKEILTSQGGSPVTNLISNDGSVKARTAFGTPLRDYAFYVENKEGHVLHVAGIEERHLPALDALRATVKNDLIEERALSTLRLRVTDARKEAQQKPLSEIAHAYKATVKKVGPVDMSDTEKINALRKEGLPVDRMLQIEKVGMADAALDNGNGYIIRLDEVAPLKQDAFDAQRQSLSEKTDRTRMTLVTQGFVASLHRNATINLNS
jgi:parvulin-like peptidyl-prolyl isomerase